MKIKMKNVLLSMFMAWFGYSIGRYIWLSMSESTALDVALTQSSVFFTGAVLAQAAVIMLVMRDEDSS